jgi:hypothetical protein
MRCVVHEMHLALQQADAIVELRGYIQGLVGSCVVGFDEGRIVCCYFGDVTVFPGAEFGVVVARRGVCGLRCGGG